MSGSMRKVDTKPAVHQFNMGQPTVVQDSPHHLIREKTHLQFVEKADRQRPHGIATLGSFDFNARDDLLSTASTLMCFGEQSHGKPDFGIGELVEEFSSLSTYTPPPTPASTCSSSEIPVENVIGTASISKDPSNSTDTLPGTLTAPLLRTLCDSMCPTLASSLPIFTAGNTNYVGVVQLSSSAPTPLMSGSDGNQLSSTSNFSPTESSVSSACDTSAANDSSNAPPRAVRRFQYWCRVLQSRRRLMCRFCYERYVRMCLDTRQPIPATYDRGMWHGHNMKEHGLVTCPHLWAVTCSHCGATKQHAHTETYCPLKRRNQSYCRSSIQNV